MYVPASQSKQSVLVAAVLYVPARHAVQDTPLSELLYPASQVPADEPPHPVLLEAHVVQATLPEDVL